MSRTLEEQVAELEDKLRGEYQTTLAILGSTLALGAAEKARLLASADGVVERAGHVFATIRAERDERMLAMAAAVQLTILAWESRRALVSQAPTEA